MDRIEMFQKMLEIYDPENIYVKIFLNFCETWEDTNWNNSILEIYIQTHEAEQNPENN